METKQTFDLLKLINTKPISILESRQQVISAGNHNIVITEKKISANTDEALTLNGNNTQIVSEFEKLTIDTPALEKSPDTLVETTIENDEAEIIPPKALSPSLKPVIYDHSHKYVNHRVSIAPMLDITSTHYRTFARLLTSHAILYTEMIHCDTILNSKILDYYLAFDPIQHPVVLQLGGSNPENLAEAAKLACERYGYDEINLNCGCPSPRVTCGFFGACLMKEPELVVDCINAIKAVVNVPVSIKCRLGVDQFDSYEFVHGFIDKVARETKIDHFIIHARKAFLKGLNPKENRTVPPLKYDFVYKLASDFPSTHFSINGGIKTIETIRELVDRGDLVGVMIGRVAYEDIWTLAKIDKDVFGVPGPGFSRKEALLAYGAYADNAMACNPLLNYVTLIKPLLSLFTGERGSTLYRRMLSERENFDKEGSVSGVMRKIISALEPINPQALDERVE